MRQAIGYVKRAAVPLVVVGMVVVMAYLAIGCAACKSCPPQDAVIVAPTLSGPVGIEIERGFFDDRDNWLTIEEWERARKASEQENRRHDWPLGEKDRI